MSTTYEGCQKFLFLQIFHFRFGFSMKEASTHLKNTLHLRNNIAVVFRLPLLLIFFCTIAICRAQTPADPEFCATPIGTIIYPPAGGCYPDYPTPVTLRIYVHFVRRNDNSGGYTTAQAKYAIDRMKNVFKEHKIFFSWEICEIDNISDSDFYYGDIVNNTRFDGLVSTNSHSNGIDIYLLPADNPFPKGRAAGIPAKALAVGGTWNFPSNEALVLTHGLSHEMGHCLGLYYTFENHGPSGCQETCDINGPDCCGCGDLVCDTKPFSGDIWNTNPSSCISTSTLPGPGCTMRQIQA